MDFNLLAQMGYMPHSQYPEIQRLWQEIPDLTPEFELVGISEDHKPTYEAFDPATQTWQPAQEDLRTIRRRKIRDGLEHFVSLGYDPTLWDSYSRQTLRQDASPLYEFAPRGTALQSRDQVFISGHWHDSRRVNGMNYRSWPIRRLLTEFSLLRDLDYALEAWSNDYHVAAAEVIRNLPEGYRVVNRYTDGNTLRDDDYNSHLLVIQPPTNGQLNRAHECRMAGYAVADRLDDLPTPDPDFDLIGVGEVIIDEDEVWLGQQIGWQSVPPEAPASMPAELVLRPHVVQRNGAIFRRLKLRVLGYTDADAREIAFESGYTILRVGDEAQEGDEFHHSGWHRAFHLPGTRIPSDRVYRRKRAAAR